MGCCCRCGSHSWDARSSDKAAGAIHHPDPGQHLVGGNVPDEHDHARPGSLARGRIIKAPLCPGFLFRMLPRHIALAKKVKADRRPDDVGLVHEVIMILVPRFEEVAHGDGPEIRAVLD